MLQSSFICISVQQLILEVLRKCFGARDLSGWTPCTLPTTMSLVSFYLFPFPSFGFQATPKSLKGLLMALH